MTRSLITSAVALVLAVASGIVYWVNHHQLQSRIAATETQVKVSSPQPAPTPTPNPTPQAVPTPAPASPSCRSFNNSSSTSIHSSSSSSVTVNGQTQTTTAPTNIEFTADCGSNLAFGVSAGSAVTITIHAGSTSIRYTSASPALDTGTIAPGGTATLHFNAAKSFRLYPSSGGNSVAINVS